MNVPADTAAHSGTEAPAEPALLVYSARPWHDFWDTQTVPASWLVGIGEHLAYSEHPGAIVVLVRHDVDRSRLCSELWSLRLTLMLENDG